MTHDEASDQAQFLARCAREHGACWQRQSTRRYAGEQIVRTAYSQYRVVDGRCVVVQRAEHGGLSRSATPRDEPPHECLGLHLVGYLIRHEDVDGIRWSMHGSPRAGSKAVFWRPTTSEAGRFVLTSRVAALDAVRVGRPEQWNAATPTGGTPPARALPARPPLPVRAPRPERQASMPPPLPSGRNARSPA